VSIFGRVHLRLMTSIFHARPDSALFPRCSRLAQPAQLGRRSCLTHRPRGIIHPNSVVAEAAGRRDGGFFYSPKPRLCPEGRQTSCAMGFAFAASSASGAAPTPRTQLAHTVNHQQSTPASCAQDPGPLDDDTFTSGLDTVTPQPRVVDASRERRLEVASPSPDADQNTVCDASTPCSSSNFCNFDDGSAGFCEPCDGCAECGCNLNNTVVGKQSCIQACSTPVSPPPSPLPGWELRMLLNGNSDVGTSLKSR
jgi:hypothetical protein